MNTSKSINMVLSKSIKNAGLTQQAKVLWVIHPLLEEMAKSFASYVSTYAIAADGTELIQHAMNEAFNAYNNESKKDEESSEKEAIAGFVKKLIENGTEVFSQRIVAEKKTGDILWSPFVCSAEKFVEDHAGATFTCQRIDRKIDRNIASALMMIKLIPHTLLTQDALSELLNEFKE